jgi:valyl-tRNA synthetase
MISSPAGNDLLFDEASLEQGRNFNNKIWNALKLVKEVWQRGKEIHVRQISKNIIAKPITMEEIGYETSSQYFAVNWFEERLNEVSVEVHRLFHQFKLSEALKLIYNLIWNDFCSWYLEWLKPETGKVIQSDIYDRTIEFFEKLLQLLHPFMPFITEEIYSKLKERAEGDDLCIKLFNQFDFTKRYNYKILDESLLLKESITKIRDIKNKNNIPPKEKIALRISTNKPHLFENIYNILYAQINANVIFVNDTKKIGDPNNIPIIEDINQIDTVVDEHKFTIETFVLIDKEKQREQLIKDLEYQKGFLLSVEKKLSNERFVQNAKPEVVDVERKKKADAEAKIKAIEESLHNL